MVPNVLLEKERRRIEAEVRVLSGPREWSAADARELVATIVSATPHLRYTWEYPRRALGEAGLEANAFCALCRETLPILDLHLALIGLARQVATEAAAREQVVLDSLGDLDEAEAQARVARRGVEDLLTFAGRPRGEGVDWDKVRQANEAFQRGEFTRLNPGARPAEAEPTAGAGPRQ
jgi:hypothetical protein